MLDYYELLGATDEAGAQDLRRAYRERIRALHPDRFGDDPAGLAMAGQMSILLNSAWATLRSPEARATYDSELRRAGRRSATPRGAAPDGPAPAGPAQPADRPGWSEDLLLDALEAGQHHVARTEGERYGRAELAELSGPVLRAARRYRSRFAVALDEPASVAAMAIAAGCRDALDSARGTDPERARVTRDIAAEAVRVLGGPVGVDSASWIENGVEPAVGASPRWRRVRVLSWLAVVLSVAGVATAAVLLGSWDGLTSLPFFADYYGPAGSAAALASAPGCLTLWLAARIRARWFAGVAGAGVPAHPMQTLHLDAVDRVRFEAGRRFTALPSAPPGGSSPD